MPYDFSELKHLEEFLIELAKAGKHGRDEVIPYAVESCINNLTLKIKEKIDAIPEQGRIESSDAEVGRG